MEFCDMRWTCWHSLCLNRFSHKYYYTLTDWLASWLTKWQVEYGGKRMVEVKEKQTNELRNYKPFKMTSCDDDAAAAALQG